MQCATQILGRCCKILEKGPTIICKDLYTLQHSVRKLQQKGCRKYHEIKKK